MIFKFGKYRGYKLADVQVIDPSYIRWARQNAPNLIPKPFVEKIPPQDISDHFSANTLRDILSNTPGKPEDAF